MSLFFADLVRETSYGTGTGALPLAGALPGHRRFADAVPEGATFLYCIAGVTHPGEWETGQGTIEDGLLVRSAAASSAGAAALTFSPGLKTVALTATAHWFAQQEAGGGGGGPAGIEDVEGLAAALADKAAAGHDHGGAYQPLNGELSALAGLASEADRLPYFNGAGSAALTPFTAAGRALIDDADAAAQRATLGLGTMATQPANNVNVTGGSMTGIVTFRVEAPTPVLTVLDSDTAGINALGYFQGRDSANAQTWTAGKQFSGGGLWFNNVNGTDLHFATGGTARLHLDAANSRLNLSAGFVVRINALPVIGARRTGWAVASGTATRSRFDTATVTTPHLAERVKALLDDLIAHGLIGA